VSSSTSTPAPGDAGSLPTRLVCAGCGFEAPPGAPFPFRCAHAGEGDVDHVLEKRFAWRSAGSAGFWREVFARDDPNPFVRYRELFHSYHVARSRGLADEDFTALARELDDRVAAVDGHGFRATPFARSRPLEEALGRAGELWIKDETSNVAGSHKGRHLFGVLLHLEIARRTALAPEDERPPLAVASCGNAALAAAVLARAAGYALQVFVPAHASPAILDRLASLGAALVTCRRTGGAPGDPCVRRFRDAIAARKALPFTCQGDQNGLVIEGGETLAYEIASSLAREGVAAQRLFVQVGGGALASACAQAFERMRDMGVAGPPPRLHAVQTRGAFPLARAWERFGAERRGAGDDALAWAATHRSELMRPWGEEPKSIAGGILDDETYDWLAVVRGMAASGGSPVVVSEEMLAAAHAAAKRATGVAVDATGSAGLAGWMALARDGALARAERSIVLFTGAERDAPAPRDAQDATIER
jgi:threonine synthase